MAISEHRAPPSPSSTEAQRKIEDLMKKIEDAITPYQHHRHNSKASKKAKSSLAYYDECKKQLSIIKSFYKIVVDPKPVDIKSLDKRMSGKERSHLNGKSTAPLIRQFIKKYQDNLSCYSCEALDAIAKELSPQPTTTHNINSLLANTFYSMTKQQELFDKAHNPKLVKDKTKHEHKYNVAKALTNLTSAYFSKPSVKKNNTHNAIIQLAESIKDNEFYDKALFTSKTKSRVSQTLHSLPLNPEQKLLIRVSQQMAKLKKSNGWDKPGHKTHAKYKVCEKLFGCLAKKDDSMSLNNLDKFLRSDIAKGFDKTIFGTSKTEQLVQSFKSIHKAKAPKAPPIEVKSTTEASEAEESDTYRPS